MYVVWFRCVMVCCGCVFGVYAVCCVVVGMLCVCTCTIDAVGALCVEVDL